MRGAAGYAAALALLAAVEVAAAQAPPPVRPGGTSPGSESGAIAAPAAASRAPVPLLGVDVPMRDGVRLVADVWLPAERGAWPTVLMRTPYLRTYDGLFEFKAVAEFWTSNGYAFVVQDTRGRGDSGGEFDFFFPEAEDGYDTIEWIAAQPWSDGKVGMVGGSYLGTVQWLAARERPPHLTCIIPQVPAGRWFDELPYVGGAFVLGWALDWLNMTSGRSLQQHNLSGIDMDAVRRHRPLLTADSVMGRVMPLYRAMLSHPTLDDYWRRIHFDDDDFRALDLPAFTWTGWFDGDQPGSLFFWRKMRAHSPAADRQHLIIGPWTHPQAIRGGALQVGEIELTGESVVTVDSLNLRWFDACLKGEATRLDMPRAQIFTTGDNVWHAFDEYPPRQVADRSLYLHSGGRANSLAGDGRLDWTAPADEPEDRFVYDPRRPVPASGGPAADQRAIERRHDVLVYSSEPLDAPLTVIGNVRVVLHAATDGRDTDWTAKLVDVFPDGRAVRLGPTTAGVIRARYRHGRDREVLLEPGEVAEYAIELFDIGHTFLPGHRIRLEVSSSAYPYVNPNQNTGNPVATDTEWRVAEQTVFHDRDRPSRLVLPLLPR